MEISSALLAALTVVVITQVFRQVLPNTFSYPWQLGLCYLVPEKYREFGSFNDKGSLFFFSKNETVIHTYPVFSQSNLRNVVLIFSICLFLFTRVGLADIKESWDHLLNLIIGVSVFQILIGIVTNGISRHNLDYVMNSVFNAAAFVVALQFITVNF